MRYDPDVRRLVVVACILGTAVAADARRRREFDPGDFPVEPCGSGKTWPIVKKCLDKTGSIEIIHQTDKTRTITITPKHSTNGSGKRVLLYAQNATGWSRTSLSMFPATSADLRVDKFTVPTGDAVRVDMVSTSRTSFTLTPSTTSVRGVLRRTFTTVCIPGNWECRTLMTSCEAYVRGKAYWSFHGELVWHASLGLRMRGGRTAAGGLCKPSESLMVDPDGT